jgi:predicted sulfurtransferase
MGIFWACGKGKLSDLAIENLTDLRYIALDNRSAKSYSYIMTSNNNNKTPCNKCRQPTSNAAIIRTKTANYCPKCSDKMRIETAFTYVTKEDNR